MLLNRKGHLDRATQWGLSSSLERLPPVNTIQRPMAQLRPIKPQNQDRRVTTPQTSHSVKLELLRTYLAVITLGLIGAIAAFATSADSCISSRCDQCNWSYTLPECSQLSRDHQRDQFTYYEARQHGLHPLGGDRIRSLFFHSLRRSEIRMGESIYLMDPYFQGSGLPFRE